MEVVYGDYYVVSSRNLRVKQKQPMEAHARALPMDPGPWY